MGPVKRAEIEPRAVVTWEGPGEPIMLTIYGPGGELNRRDIFRQNRSAALAEWRQLAA